MTFEEDYPSLKGKDWDIELYYDEIDISRIGSYSPVRKIPRRECYDVFKHGKLFFSQNDIAEHCTDNQRIREAIKKVLGSVDEQVGPIYPKELMCCLEKELRL